MKIYSLLTINLIVMMAAFCLQAEEPATLPGPDNAALVYWQAFAALPPKPQSTAPEKMRAWVKESSRALGLLHDAAVIKKCDWGVDFSKGFELALPHLSKMRELTQAALARAETRFQKNPEQAHADMQAAMRAAQHVGSDNLLICQLVRIAIEKQVADMLIKHADTLSVTSKKSWRQCLTSIPKPPTLAEVVETEREISIGAMRPQMRNISEKKLADTNRLLGLHLGSVTEARELVEQTDTDYRELVRLAGLPSAERAAAFAEFERKLDNAGPAHQLSRMLIPALGKMSDRLRQAEEKMAKLRQLVAEDK